MRIFLPLRRRAMALLWGGQLLSSLGDEVSRVATVWIATRLWGASARRLAAVHALSACVLSLVGGALVQRRSARAVQALCYGSMFGLFFVSPWLFRSLGALCVSLAAAGVISACGAVGLLLAQTPEQRPDGLPR